MPRPAGGTKRHTGDDGSVQSAFVEQPTQVFVFGSQCGVVPLQLPSVWHCKHVIVVESHIGAAVGQSLVVRQPTQAPVFESHTLGCPGPVGHVAPPSPQEA
jgi:hypothetical protein